MNIQEYVFKLHKTRIEKIMEIADNTSDMCKRFESSPVNTAELLNEMEATNKDSE